MAFNNFLEKHNVIISFFLGIIGLAISFISNDTQVIAFRIVIFLLFSLITWLLINLKSLRNHIRKLEHLIRQKNNTIGNITLEVVNRFRNSPDRNDGLSFEQDIQEIEISCYDVSITREYFGRCVSNNGTNSIFVELYGDSNVPFSEINFSYYDLINNAKQALTVTQVQEFNKLYIVEMRFLKKLKKGDSFHIKYSCKFANCMSYGEDYYSTRVQKNIDGLKMFKFGLKFVTEKPDCVEVFDATGGGESEYINQLNTNNSELPFLYEYLEERINDAKDFVFKFKRPI